VYFWRCNVRAWVYSRLEYPEVRIRQACPFAAFLVPSLPSSFAFSVHACLAPFADVTTANRSPRVPLLRDDLSDLLFPCGFFMHGWYDSFFELGSTMDIDETVSRESYRGFDVVQLRLGRGAETRWYITQKESGMKRSYGFFDSMDEARIKIDDLLK
jgi:hypothetical protein